MVGRAMHLGKAVVLRAVHHGGCCDSLGCASWEQGEDWPTLTVALWPWLPWWLEAGLRFQQCRHLQYRSTYMTTFSFLK